MIFIRLWSRYFVQLKWQRTLKSNRQSIVLHKGDLYTVVEFRKESLQATLQKDKYWHLGFLLSTAIIHCMIVDATIFVYHGIHILKFNRHTWYIPHEHMKNFLLYFWWYFCLTFLFLNNSNSGRFQNYYVHFWRGKNQVVNVKRTAGLTATLLLLLRFYKRWFVGILVCHFMLHKLDMKIRNYEKDRQNTIKYSVGSITCI